MLNESAQLLWQKNPTQNKTPENMWYLLFYLTFHRLLRRDFFLAEVTSSEEKGSGWFYATTKGREWMWDLGHAGVSYYVEVMLNQKVWVKSFSDNFSYT